jgi:hypothetical protein
MNEPTVLFETVFGSKLYGLAHEGSDNDTYRVVSELGGRRKNKTKHVIAGNEDVFTIDLKSFMYEANVAHPQALEAMFSTVANEGPFSAYRRGFRVSLSTMHESYRERVTVESRGGMKQRRHALRWALNFREAVNRGGIFNPTLSVEEAAWVKEMASSKDYCKAVKSAFPYEITLDGDLINQRIDEENKI